MSQQRYTPEFKDEAVRQVTEKGHSVQDVAARLGVSSHSLYKWVKAVKPEKDEQRADELLDAKKEILKLRAELRRVQEERDILKKLCWRVRAPLVVAETPVVELSFHGRSDRWLIGGDDPVKKHGPGTSVCSAPGP